MVQRKENLIDIISTTYFSTGKISQGNLLLCYSSFQIMLNECAFKEEKRKCGTPHKKNKNASVGKQV